MMLATGLEVAGYSTALGDRFYSEILLLRPPASPIRFRDSSSSDREGCTNGYLTRTADAHSRFSRLLAVLPLKQHSLAGRSALTPDRSARHRGPSIESVRCSS